MPNAAAQPRQILGLWIQKLRQASMAGVMEAVVGHWGDAFISIGVILSVLGAYLARTMMAALRRGNWPSS